MIRIILAIFFLVFSPWAHAFDDEERIIQCLDEYFPNAASSDIYIEPMLGGASSVGVYYLEVEGKAYVLRLLSYEHSENSMKREIRAARAASQAGIAPALYWIAPDFSAFLMDYVKGKPLTMNTGRDPIAMEKIAKALQKVHSLAIKNLSSYRVIDEYREKYQLLMDSPLKSMELELIMQESNSIYDELERRGYPLTVIHGDLHAGNVLLTKNGVQLIDWSETMLEDPLYDLIYLSLMLDYSADEEMLFLESYFGGPLTLDQKEHFGMFRRIALTGMVITLLWAAYEWSNSDRAPLDFSKEHKGWNWYVRQFVERREETTAQDLYEWGQSALEKMHSEEFFWQT